MVGREGVELGSRMPPSQLSRVCRDIPGTVFGCFLLLPGYLFVSLYLVLRPKNVMV